MGLTKAIELSLANNAYVSSKGPNYSKLVWFNLLEFRRTLIWASKNLYNQMAWKN
jgi:hypothetical protein